MPLSSFQEAYWHRDRGTPGTFAIISRAFEISGPLDVSALQAAVEQVVLRHDALRMRIEMDDGRPVQRVVADVQVPFDVVDLVDLDVASQGTEVQRLRQRELDSPFDLSQEPLVRARLLRLQHDRHLFLLTVHHIVCDGWSLGVLLAELAEAYVAAVEGRASRLPPVSAQQGDFVSWQRGVADARLAETTQRWRQRLQSLPPPLDLPAARPRHLVSTYTNARHVLELDDHVVADLAGLQVAVRVTRFIALFAAFLVTLRQLCARDDLVVCSVLAGRERVEFERVVGLLANPTVLRFDLSDDSTFVDVLHRVRGAVLDAHDDQAVPFPDLLRAMSPNPSQWLRSVASIWFNSSPVLPQLHLPGVVVRSEGPGPSLRYRKDSPAWEGENLTVNVITLRDSIAISIDYNKQMYDAPVVTNLAQKFAGVVEKAALDPARPISALC